MRIDEATQVRTGAGGGDVAAYLAGDMSADEYRLALVGYQERKAAQERKLAPVVSLSRITPAAKPTEEPAEASSDAA
jgi:hypothetical protein